MVLESSGTRRSRESCTPHPTLPRKRGRTHPSLPLPRQCAAGAWREMHGDDAAGGMVEGARGGRADALSTVERDQIVARRAEIDLAHYPAARGVAGAVQRVGP